MFDLKVLLLAVCASILAGAAGGGYAAWQYQGVKANNQLLELRRTYDTATTAAKDQSRAVEQGLQRTINDLSKKARDESNQIDSRVAVVASGTDSLLHAADQHLSAAACDPGVARRGEAATSAAYLYSQLLGESQRLAAGLAEEADRTRSAGASCEVAYELVRKGIGGIAKGSAVTGG